jgi:hypothetical protein
MTTPLKPTTPLTAQLEKLLGTGPTPASAMQAPVIPAAALMQQPQQSQQQSQQQSAVASAQSSAHGTPRGSMTGDAPAPAGADPSAALDNLFAAKFSFQFGQFCVWNQAAMTSGQRARKQLNCSPR